MKFIVRIPCIYKNLLSSKIQCLFIICGTFALFKKDVFSNIGSFSFIDNSFAYFRIGNSSCFYDAQIVSTVFNNIY